jgi:hypothetical protein
MAIPARRQRDWVKPIHDAMRSRGDFCPFSYHPACVLARLRRRANRCPAQPGAGCRFSKTNEDSTQSGLKLCGNRLGRRHSSPGGPPLLRTRRRSDGRSRGRPPVEGLRGPSSTSTPGRPPACPQSSSQNLKLPRERVSGAGQRPSLEPAVERPLRCVPRGIQPGALRRWLAHCSELQRSSAGQQGSWPSSPCS